MREIMNQVIAHGLKIVNNQKTEEMLENRYLIPKEFPLEKHQEDEVYREIIKGIVDVMEVEHLKNVFTLLKNEIESKELYQYKVEIDL